MSAKSPVVDPRTQAMLAAQNQLALYSLPPSAMPAPPSGKFQWLPMDSAQARPGPGRPRDAQLPGAALDGAVKKKKPSANQARATFSDAQLDGLDAAFNVNPCASGRLKLAARLLRVPLTRSGSAAAQIPAPTIGRTTAPG